MRHRKSQLKIGKRTKEQKKALFRSLVTAFFSYGKLEITETRAKLIQPIIDRVIIKAKNKDKMNAIREIKKVVYTVDASKKVMEAGERFATVSSGFTSIVPIKLRDGDAAKIVQIEFINTKQ